jgi:hypothetical protein
MYNWFNFVDEFREIVRAIPEMAGNGPTINRFHPILPILACGFHHQVTFFKMVVMGPSHFQAGQQSLF